MKTKEIKMNLGYVRCSRESQRNSIDTQKKMIFDFCEINSLPIDDIVVDFGVSGSGEKTKMRDGYNSVMKMVEEGKVDNLIVLSLSRFGRNLGEIYKSVELMVEKDVGFYSIKENIDTSSIYGRFTINLLSSLYEMELGLIRERVSDTLKVKKENNEVYSPTPYGKDRVGKTLKSNPKEVKMIRKMVRLRKLGNTYQYICDFLNRNRYKTKGGKKWSRENVYSVLKIRLNDEICFN
jgi:DNA invertase Pin-like site-specific DNA recombinase